MSDQLLSRRKFLAGAGAILGLAVMPSVLTKPEVAEAAASKDFPWSYTALDADKVARSAYETYYASGCMEATWWPIVKALADSDLPDAATTWGTLPKNMMKFGGGGVAGWGTLCGTLNGSCAIIAAVGGPTKISDEAMQYYAETPLPTNGVDRSMRAGGWTPAGPNVPVDGPLVNVPTSTANSQLCHASLSQWTMTTGSADGTRQQKDRCGKACYDMVFKTVTMLNAWKASGALPAGTLDASIAACQTACHTTPIAKGKMACDSCHDETPTHATSAK
ncbi:MAG TPA: hypothetical protein VIL17_01185 [Coriobacteriia bacterium]